jgi:heme-degrading monooxygenase HmoA
MILEVAILNEVPGREAEFEDAFRHAQRLIASMSGYRSHQLRCSIQAAQRYIQLVGRDRLENHTRGFRGSLQYQDWRRLLHHCYDPFPVVEHYGRVPGVADKPIA